MISRALQKPLLIALLKKASIFRLLRAVQVVLLVALSLACLVVRLLSRAELSAIPTMSKLMCWVLWKTTAIWYARTAEGSLRVANSDIAVAVTGIAGPGGAVPGKPVGTVWFGLATKNHTKTFIRHFDGNRNAIRSATVDFALELFAYALDDSRSEPVSD